MNWKRNLREQLKREFGNVVKITFIGNDPTLVFKDRTRDKTKKTVMKFVKILYKEYGGEVIFHPELERKL